MCTQNEVKINDPAFLHHLSFLQNIITRMASCSSLFKTITITITAALITLLYQKQSCSVVIISIVIIFILSIIDAKYLQLEQSFRQEYNRVVSMAHEGKLVSDELLNINRGEVCLLSSYISWSVLGYYVPLMISIFVFYRLF